MAKAIHTMIRVFDESKSVNFYDKAFGLTISSRLDFDDFTLVYLKDANSGFEIELTVNKDQAEPYTHGSGYGHIAFIVDDLESEHVRFKAAGFAPRDIVAFENEGSLIARFFFVTDPDGYEIEVLQKHGHYQ